MKKRNVFFTSKRFGTGFRKDATFSQLGCDAHASPLNAVAGSTQKIRSYVGDFGYGSRMKKSPYAGFSQAIPQLFEVKKMIRTGGLVWMILCMAIGCGGDAFNEGEDYGNLLNTPGGLTLNQSKHQLGWGDSQCTICHNLENIHLVNRTGTTLNIVAVHDRAISEGISGCAACHGANGVP